MPSSTRWLAITFAARKTKLQMRKALLLAASFALAATKMTTTTTMEAEAQRFRLLMMACTGAT